MKRDTTLKAVVYNIALQHMDTQIDVTMIHTMKETTTIMTGSVRETQDGGVSPRITVIILRFSADFGTAWCSDSNSESHLIRETIINATKLDIIGIAESHLRSSDVINIENFMWFGHYRDKLHKNAKRGSGGVAFFVSKSLIFFYDTEVIDKITEGILWICFKLKLKGIKDAVSFYACLCYLPPQGSSRMIVPTIFHDTLLRQMHAPFYVCGDFLKFTNFKFRGFYYWNR